jgi:hypothetical protein
MQVSYCIGYIGMTLHYHTITLIPEQQKITLPKSFKKVEPRVIMLSPRRKFYKKHKSTKSNERTRRNSRSSRSF